MTYHKVTSVGARFADYDEVEAVRKATALRPQAAVASTSSKRGVDDDGSANKKFKVPAQVLPLSVAAQLAPATAARRRHGRGSGGGGSGRSSESGTHGPPVAPRVGGAGSAGGTSPASLPRQRPSACGRGGGGRGGGGRGGNSDGGRSVGGLRSASSEDGAEPPPVPEGDAEPPRVPTTDAEWEKLNAAQSKYFETWKPIASGGAAQLNRARHLMTQLSNVRGSHVKDANVAIAAIHVKHHPAVFPMALSFYSIPCAGRRSRCRCGCAATCSPTCARWVQPFLGKPHAVLEG